MLLVGMLDSRLRGNDLVGPIDRVEAREVIADDMDRVEASWGN
jgi:hypothetical protein